MTPLRPTTPSAASAIPHGRNRRALVVAYVFPPAGGAGVQRVTKFVKYLADFGWDCSVLTVANPSVPVFDDTLLADIPAGTAVHHAKTLEPGYALKNLIAAGSTSGSATTASHNTVASKSRRPSKFATAKQAVKRVLKSSLRAIGNAVLQPDAQILWYPQAVRAGLRILRDTPHDAIFVTAPPFSSLVTAAAISRRSGLPLVVDYRDEWGISNQYQENRQKSSLSAWWQARMQRRVLRQASAVIATTRRSADSLRQLTTTVGSTARVTHIYNGFDATDVPSTTTTAAATEVTIPDPHNSVPRRLHLAYVGTLWKLTSIEPVVSAIRRLAESRPDLADRIDLTVAGRRTAEQDALLDQLSDLPCRVTREGYVDHHRAIELMNGADALCLLLSELPEADRVVPAKTFEYIALQRPILAIVPTGETSELLADCPDASHFEPHNIDGLTDWVRNWLDVGHASTRTANDIFKRPATTWNATAYERRTLTGHLTDVLNDVIHRHGCTVASTPPEPVPAAPPTNINPACSPAADSVDPDDDGPFPEADAAECESREYAEVP